MLLRTIFWRRFSSCSQCWPSIVSVARLSVTIIQQSLEIFPELIFKIEFPNRCINYPTCKEMRIIQFTVNFKQTGQKRAQAKDDTPLYDNWNHTAADLLWIIWKVHFVRRSCFMQRNFDLCHDSVREISRTSKPERAHLQRSLEVYIVLLQ